MRKAIPKVPKRSRPSREDRKLLARSRKRKLQPRLSPKKFKKTRKFRRKPKLYIPKTSNPYPKGLSKSGSIPDDKLDLFKHIQQSEQALEDKWLKE